MNEVFQGFAACLVSSLFFGSMFVPIRKYDARDGFFVQWVMCAAIFCAGMIVNAVEGFPTFHPLAMLGGALWTIGNATAVPIISMIGMGMGMLIWGTINCVTGWATSRFGLFGLKAEVPSNVYLNYTGLVCVVIGGIFFSRVKSRPHNVRSLSLNEDEQDTRRLVDPDDEFRNYSSANSVPLQAAESRKAIAGIILSVLAGVLYGCTFVPVIFIQQHPEQFKDASARGVSYVFATYCGIFFTSTFLLFGYSVWKKNKPFINKETILPGFVTGGMWAVAQVSWFIANDRLSQAITFPIISMLPGICAAGWSVFYYREIEGRRNFRILVFAVLLTLTGATCVGFSKGF